ncbi:MAG: hypothetical protein AB1742_05730 [bacterium]
MTHTTGAAPAALTIQVRAVPLLLALCLACRSPACARVEPGGRAVAPATSFQSSTEWDPQLHLPIDVAMVYGPNPAKIASWAERGYVPWAMFSASWLGKNEEIVTRNPDIVQTARGGVPFEMILGRAWVVPVGPWLERAETIAAEAVAAGARAILPEEPEFFAVTGYSGAFREAWAQYYGEPWAAPHESPANQWRANRLKAHLFTEYYKRTCGRAKSSDPAVKCIIPVHSNLNYADWQIVAPHHSFSVLPETDGFVAQVWTGTAKHPHFAGGAPFAGAFDFAFLEYSFFAGLVAGTRKEMWFLTDPVEDAPGAPWDALRNWYEQTLIAALMHTDVNRYECLPWPNRVFMPPHHYGGGPIPESYASELLTVWAAQRDMPAAGEFVEPVNTEVGFLTSDTLMWQRGLGADRFRGFIAPLLAAVRDGVYARVVPAERFAEPDWSPRGVRVLVAGFDAWKPAERGIVEGLARWVKEGGVLLYVGGGDEYDGIGGAWWREEGFESPSDALLAELSLECEEKRTHAPTAAISSVFGAATQLRTVVATDGAPEQVRKIGRARCPLPITTCAAPGAEVFMTTAGKPVAWEAAAGKGWIVYAGFPGEFAAHGEGGVEAVMGLVRHALEARAGIPMHSPGAFVLRRGRFVVARGIRGETTLAGVFINLLRPEERVRNGLELRAGENAFLLDVERAVSECAGRACVIHAGGNLSDEDFREDGARKLLSFRLAGPAGRTGYAWVHVPPGAAPEETSGLPVVLHAASGTVRVAAPLAPEGRRIEIAWR